MNDLKQMIQQLQHAVRLARVAYYGSASTHSMTIEAFTESAKDNLEYLMRDLNAIVKAQEEQIQKQKRITYGNGNT